MSALFFAKLISAQIYYPPDLQKKDMSSLISHSNVMGYVDQGFSEDELKIDSPACKDFYEYVFSEMNTYGLMVIKNNKVLVEAYSHEANESSRIKVWSVSKTFSGLLLGYLIAQNKLSLDDYVIDYIELPESDFDFGQKSNMTLRHTWTMGTGLEWCEYPYCGSIDPLKLLFSTYRENGTDFVANSQLTHQPGAIYRYSAGNYMLMHSVFKKVLGEQAYLNLPFEFLSKMGINENELAFEADGQNVFIGGAGLWVNLATYAKIGQLILNKGSWNNNNLITHSFMNEMTRIADSILSPQTPKWVKHWEGPVGGSVWLNKKQSELPQFFPYLNESLVYGGGRNGQFLMVYPDSNLILARIGWDAKHTKHWKPFAVKGVSCFAPDELVDNDNSMSQSYEDVEPEYDMEAVSKSVLYSAKNNIFARMIAIERCNCYFLSGFKDFNKCQQMLDLNGFFKSLLDGSINGLADGFITGKPLLNLNYFLNSRHVLEYKEETKLDENNPYVVKTSLHESYSGLSLGTAKAFIDPENQQLGCALEADNE